VHEAAFCAVLNMPLVQDAHTRSVVAVPSLATKAPARQLVLGTHVVAGLLSLSQVPAEQLIWGLAPPASDGLGFHVGLHGDRAGAPYCPNDAHAGIQLHFVLRD